jgi:UDP-GlcNAc:undecaprenyl-phosphate/decaprenyl-phosphate GlcNAc-1-phosphate transferase
MSEETYYLLVYNSFFVCAVIFSFLINKLFLKFSKTLGSRNANDGTIIRWGTQSKPAFGGISFYIIFLLSIASYSFFFNLGPVVLNKGFVGILLAVTVGFLMGLADDAYNTKPFLKFLVQVFCGIILILTDIYIQITPFPLFNYFLTILWVVGIMNAINMLDNMDAITTLVSIVILLICCITIILNRDFTNLHFFILTGVQAALAGFLYFNWYPSKMYMGDTGSQFLGVLLGAIGIIYFWNAPYEKGEVNVMKQLIKVALVFILPLVDTAIVIITRIFNKQSPFIGGSDHTTHSLALLGLTDRQVAYVFTLLSALSVIFIIVIDLIIEEWIHMYTIIFAGYLLTIFISLFYITLNQQKKKMLKEEKENIITRNR